MNTAGASEAMVTVGVRELKSRLSDYLRRIRRGERIVVTDRGRPVAMISPTPGGPEERRVQAFVREGLVRWAGGKPKGVRRPARVRGRSVAEAVIEDRR